MEGKLKCVMLIDDDTITNFIHKKLLKKLNVANEIHVANNGEEGLDYMVEHCQVRPNCCPEVIFLDINMPVMDGFEFLKNFIDCEFVNKNKVKIAILTSSSNPIDFERVRSLGNFDYLVKPLTEEKIRNILLCKN